MTLFPGVHTQYAVATGDASALMSLARNKDSELLQAFEGCFEGDEYKGEIDDDLFLAQVSVVLLDPFSFRCDVYE